MEIERIEDQLKRAFEGEAWHGPSVREVLAGVTAEPAAAKPIPNAHSIWELALHIAAWEGAVRRRVQGEKVDLSSEEDWPPVKDTSEAAWKKTLETLENNHKELRKTVSGLSDSQLEQTVRGQAGYFYHLLHGVIQHDLYHAGQIAILKKAWK